MKFKNISIGGCSAISDKLFSFIHFDPDLNYSQAWTYDFDLFSTTHDSLESALNTSYGPTINLILVSPTRLKTLEKELLKKDIDELEAQIDRLKAELMEKRANFVYASR